MAISNILKKQDYTVGIKTINARPIPVSAKTIKVTAMREGWKINEGMRMQVQVSISGKPWFTLMKCKAKGGKVLDEYRQEIIETTMFTKIPHPEITNRRVRAKIEFFNVMATKLDVEFL